MGRLTLIRHGESIWNQQNRFTGWVDVSLSPRGVAQAQAAARLLADEKFDIAFTSALLRAQDTLYEILRVNRHCFQYLRIHEAGREWYEHYVPAEADRRELRIYVTEKLNERYYGDLQGLDKDVARARFGADQVHRWRRAFDAAPPNGESLAATAERVMPYFRERIAPHLIAGRHVLISGHGNSLRALIMHLEQLTPEAVEALEVPTGAPHIYELDADLKVLNKQILESDP